MSASSHRRGGRRLHAKGILPASHQQLSAAVQGRAFATTSDCKRWICVASACCSAPALEAGVRRWDLGAGEMRRAESNAFHKRTCRKRIAYQLAREGYAHRRNRERPWSPGSTPPRPSTSSAGPGQIVHRSRLRCRQRPTSRSDAAALPSESAETFSRWSFRLGQLWRRSAWQARSSSPVVLAFSIEAPSAARRAGPRACALPGPSERWCRSCWSFGSLSVLWRPLSGPAATWARKVTTGRTAPRSSPGGSNRPNRGIAKALSDRLSGSRTPGEKGLHHCSPP